MIQPNEFPPAEDEGPFEDVGWARLPADEDEVEDGPPSDFRPFREDPD